ncbi:MAG: sulfite exporter TauE/SafE family protein [Betaproteobacteria bacterium]|nr:sulfite exporter TauE/SafE family protein [Betaproteobacteria bacterium]PWB59458.1 MAG: permease [Betaproteobacteria bacterium]
MPSAAIVATLAVTALVTSFISGILGMAGGMIFMGVLLALLTVPQAMVLHGVTQLASNGWRAVLWRTSIDWRVFRGNAYGSLAALAAFTLVQLVASKPVALLVLGITPFIGLAMPERLVLDVQRRGHPLLCGVICTGLQLVAGVSGPILDVFFVRSRMDRRQVVATKASIQSLGHIIKITYFGGLVGAAQRGSVDFWLGALMVALAIAGTTMSRRILERLTDASFRQWTRWAVMSMGVFYLASGTWLLLRP